MDNFKNTTLTCITGQGEDHNADLEEKWLDIQGYEGLYQISNLGKVKSVRRNIIMKPYVCNKYERVSFLVLPNKPKAFFVHYLVASAFIGKKPEGTQVNHIDGNKLNNRWDNLQYLTAKENMRHAVKTGLVQLGEKHHQAVLTNAQAEEIRLLSKNFSQTAIAKSYGVSVAIVHRIVNNQSYKPGG